MKHTKLISSALIAVMAFSLTACKDKEKGIELIADPDTENAESFFMHDKTEEEPILKNCIVSDILPATADVPLVSGLENRIYCQTIDNKTINEDLTVYVFDYDEDYKWNTEDAYASFEGTPVEDFQYRPGGTIELVDSNAILFQGKLPKKMEPGVYTMVFVDTENKIRGIKDCDLVGLAGTRNLYRQNQMVDKPVIYLYPDETTAVDVRLDLDFDLTCSYPAYNDGWKVIASPDGKLLNKENNRYYDYLFWEGKTDLVFGGFDKAACIKGEDTAAFLEEYLERAGLNPSEIDDFISFWLPKMESNPYNLISFPTEEYAKSARLNVSPAPDSEIRVFMIFKALDQEIEIAPEHSLEMPSGGSVSREGFTLVEWGGTEIK